MIFRLYWAWWDSYWEAFFQHEDGPLTDKTESEWQEDCKRALLSCFDEYLAQEKGMPSVVRWFEFGISSIESVGYKKVDLPTFSYTGTDIVYAEDRSDIAALKTLFGEEWIRKMAEASEHRKKEIDERLFKHES